MWRRRTKNVRWKRLGALTQGTRLRNGDWLHLVSNLDAGCYELVELRNRMAADTVVYRHGFFRTPEEATSRANELLRRT